MTFCEKDVKQLLELSKRGVFLEGNILKVLTSECPEFEEYLKVAKDKDRESRRKRLEITKQIQTQNRDLIQKEEENLKLLEDLKSAFAKAEEAKTEALAAKAAAENDLDIIQKRTQFELMGVIVKVALFVVIGVGVTTTVLYIAALYSGKDTQIIGSTWSNTLGILLTNAFSIIGTIMGVKYASEKPKNE